MSTFDFAQLYAVLIFAGAVLLTLELFLPGGIVGSFGVFSLIAAAVVAFKAFNGIWGPIASVGAIFITVAAVVLLMKIFPKTKLGKSLTVDNDLSSSKSSDSESEELIGATGTASSELRPGGFALINGKRIDVITRGEDIRPGSPVKVIDVEGNRIVVEKIS